MLVPLSKVLSYLFNFHHKIFYFFLKRARQSLKGYMSLSHTHSHTCEPFLLPGRLMMRVLPLMPHTGLEGAGMWLIRKAHRNLCVCLCVHVHLDSMPRGVTFNEPMSMARAIPGASRSITSLVAWKEEKEKKHYMVGVKTTWFCYAMLAHWLRSLDPFVPFEGRVIQINSKLATFMTIMKISYEEI